MKKYLVLLTLSLSLSALISCEKGQDTALQPADDLVFDWNGANIYFLLVDRFNNADSSNDLTRDDYDTAPLRGYMGGDLKGVTEKIKAGYFTDLGVNAIWMNPVVEQIRGATDEGTGLTTAYHGYWTKDWTAIEPNLGNEDDLRALVEAAHEKGIRIILDAVINHTGPVTELDPVWPMDWVRTEPKCTYDSYDNYIKCTLVDNLPDVLTASDVEVELPEDLILKWKSEGRYDQELAELDAFFERTGYPRAPRFYIIKWLTDYITDYGIDGYRVDTAKHVEENVWGEFNKEADYAFEQWKKKNPDKVLDDNEFYTVGEVYNYNLNTGRWFDFGDVKVDYYKEGFDHLINFGFRWQADGSIEELFALNDEILQGELKGFGTLNYLDSHDDGNPYDKERLKGYEAANRLLLAPGASQIYYGDELNRPLAFEEEGVVGDANLRSFMNWEDLENEEGRALYDYWSTLGRFRAKHPAVGAGKHKVIPQEGEAYVFTRRYTKAEFSDVVLVAMNLDAGLKTIEVGDDFMDGSLVRDFYSGEKVRIEQGKVSIDSPYGIILIEEAYE